jgi:lysylphosphatidylglycerol synthetase-like protein (DUF2156 family)
MSRCPYGLTPGTVAAADHYGAMRHRGAKGPPMISILVTLVIIGLLLWLVNNYIPMDGKIKSILNVIIVIAVIIWLLQAFGLLGGVGLR